MKHKWTRATSLALMVFLGMSLMAEAEISLPLKPGYAVHTMGVSPDAALGDGNATVRIYDTTGRGYTASRPTADFNATSYADPRWNIDTIGNVYGIAIDKDRNILVTASANWSPGYVDRGEANQKNVPVKYGSIGGGETNTSAGTVYKIDAKTGKPTVFAQLPQTQVNITNQVCQGTGDDVIRNGVGAGLGNIAYDKFHNQFFVSDFSDGMIYRLDSNGNKLDYFDTDFNGINADGKILSSPYGLAVSPDGKHLFFGTMETNYKPQLFSIDLKRDGSFGTHIEDQKAQLTEQITYSQNIGGGAYDGADSIWAAYSDLTFTPDGGLLVGVRIGCKGNFATSYNHGGVVYLLKKGDDGHYNQASSKTSSGTSNYNEVPDGTGQKNSRAGYSKDDDGNKYYNRDDGAIPLHPDEDDQKQAKLEYGPDDGYGGVAVWQTSNGDFDLYATSSDITMGEGVHGFMQFSGDFNISSDTETLVKVIGYKAVASSVDTDGGVNNGNVHDYKGIGGDVEVLSVVPVSIGSCVWLDEDKDGIQDDDEPGIGGVELTLYDKEGHEINTTTTKNDCTYQFTDLAEGDYRVCVTNVPNTTTAAYTKTPIQNGADNDDTPNDSNFMNDSNCSGVFTLVANSEPVNGEAKPGDDQDDAHDTWGNMTVDFGYVKNVFDLALKKELVGAPDHKYEIGETVQFKITVKNQGNVDATNVVVKDTLPKGLKLSDSRWSNDGTFTIASIKAKGKAVVDINCTVTKEVGEETSLINVAEIAEAHNQFDLNDTDSVPGKNPCGTDMDNDNNYDGNTTGGCDDVDPAKIGIEQHFDLAIKKQVDAPAGTTFKPGDEVTFIITVYNQGTVTAKNIQIQDMIPDQLHLSDSRWKQVGNDAVLKTPISIIKPGENATRKITFTIDANATGKIVNIAEIKSADNDAGLPDDDSKPGDGVCEKDQDNKPGYAKGGCDDVDPAVITVPAVDGATQSKSDSSSTEEACDCAGVQGNKVDAMSTWMMALMILSIVMIGFLQSRERTVQ